MLLNPLLLPAFSVAHLPNSLSLSRRDYSKFEPLYKEFKDEFNALPVLANTCWDTFLAPEVEACQRQQVLVNEFHTKYFRKMWGEDYGELTETGQDFAIRGSCMYMLAMPEIQKVENECMNHFCAEGSDERKLADDSIKKSREIYERKCPELMDQWKDSLEKGFVFTTTIYPLPTLETVDGKEVLVSVTTTSSLSVGTQTPITLPDEAWAFTTAFKKTTKTAETDQPEKTPQPSKTDAAGNKPEETKDSVNLTSDETKDADKPDSAASGRLVGSAFLGIAIFASTAWAVVGC